VLSREPPLASGAARTETRLPGHVESREVVTVGLDGSGAPVAVRVRQRLLVRGTGDYFFSVLAPVLEVQMGPASESEPGVRSGSILWQGFAYRRRVLESDARLDPGRAAGVLPLRVSLALTVGGRPLRAGERRSGELELALRVENATTLATATVAGRGDRGELVQVLDRLRRATERGLPLPPPQAHVEGPLEQRDLLVDAPLRVSGELVFPRGQIVGARVRGARLAGRGLSFAGLLGDGGPLRLTVELRGNAAGLGAPRLHLTATPQPPRALRPTDAPTWAAALRRGRAPGGRRLLALTVETLYRAARSRQYGAFLANPDPAGPSRALYVYRSAAPRVGAAAPAPAPGGGHGALFTILLVAGLGAAAGGLLVLWAHS
jgi:hypothetical protein